MLKFMIKGGIMNNKDVFELTNPQRNIWNTELFFSDTNINNICVSSIIDEVVDFNLLKKAINTLVELNESFRIKLCIENTIPMQYISDFMPFDIDIIELESMDKFKALEQSTVEEKFSLFDCNLFKFKLIKFSDGKGGIILNIHHIISDSWSLGLTIKEILKIYHCLKSGNDYISDTFPYSNLINSEKVYKSSNRYEEDKKFWNTYLENLSEPVTIPSINKKVNLTSSLAKRTSFIMEKDMVKKISDFCVQKKISNYSFFMSIFALYIANVSNSNDLILGTPILNRLNYKDKSTTGMFVTTMPFRFSLNNSDTFENFISNTSINLVSLLRHQKYPYSDIIDNIRDNDTDTPNLYNIAISYQITKAVSKDIGNYETHWVFNNNCLNDMNIHLYDANNTGKIEIDYDYLSEKYTEEEIKANHARILHMINQVLKNPSILLSEIEVITPEEKEKILNDFNNRTLACPFEKNIIKLFEEQVEKNPNNNALIYKDEKFTYSELNQIVNKLARFLKNKNIQKNDIVGVYMNKNSWFIISILAIQKLGAAYLPMHPDYPEDRVNYILQDSNTKLLLTDQDFLNNICETINPSKLELDNFDDCNLNIDFSSDNLCYVIYTSGSTGKPKGVLLTHYNLINFLYNFNDCFDKKFSPEDNCLSVANLSFDASVQEIYTPLCFGATLIIYPKNTLTNIPLLCDILEKNHITFSFLPPNILDDIFNFIYINHRGFNINKLSVGVEAIKNDTLNNFYKLNNNIEIVNGYGPSEATICSTFFKYKYNENKGIVPIGFPLKNNKIYILNQLNNLQPVGFPGELCVSGKSVSLGYLNNKDLTKKSFNTISSLSSTPVYKTGDICYWFNNGCISFIGRSDSQVKFRGHRIELTEINKTIKNIDGVLASYTLIKEVNKIPCICSYISTSSPTINDAFIKDRLNEILPYYMIPSYIINLKNMPLTLNGKIDYKNLPEIIVSSTHCIQPSTQTERKLFQMVCTLLNLKNISVDDDFFSFGMDSLMAIRLTLEIYNEFNLNLTVHELFKYNTIILLAKYIDNYDISKTININDINIPKANELEYYPLSSAQKRIYYTSKMIGENNLVYNVPGAILIKGHLNKEKVENCFKHIIKAQSSFRTSFVLDSDNNVKQKVYENIEFKIPTFTNKITEKDNIINTFPKPFDLSKAPLLRVELHYLDDDTSLLLLDSHHIIMDGSSLGILINEFCQLYDGKDIHKLDIEYKDFAMWEDTFIRNRDIKKAENYWVNKFKDSDFPSINLPYDFNIPSSRTYTGNTISKSIDERSFKKYIEYAQKMGVSPYMFFISAFFILLYKYTGQQEIILGSPSAGRYNYQLKNIIGMFVNNLVIRAKITSSQKFVDFLNEIKEQVLQDLEYQNYPYDLLVKKLNIKTDTFKNPLFDIMFTYQNTGENTLTLENETAIFVSPKSNISKFNLSLEINPISRIINLEYCTDLFEESTINKIFEHYITTLDNIVENENIYIKNIDIISNKERNILLNVFNNTNFKYDDTMYIHKLFEQQVLNTPDDIALVFENQKLTYKDLNEKANCIANYLKNKNIKNNDIIGILIPRSLELIIAMLGVLKSGACYTPIDPTYPSKRIQYMLENSNSKLLLTTDKLYNLINFENKVCIDINNKDLYSSNTNNPCCQISPEDSSYIIYTSGSTGLPKGVILKHKSLTNLCYYLNSNVEFLNNTCKYKNIVSITTASFDIFILETLISLQRGLKVILANEDEQRIPSLLNNLICQNDGQIIQMTPSRMQFFIDNIDDIPSLSKLKYVVLAGEPLPLKLRNSLLNLGIKKVYNGYGPSETTVFSSFTDVTNQSIINIGKPLSNTQMYLLDNDLNPVPIGIPGELFISGDGVGKGYLNRPDITKERFLANPFDKHKIMYKTGDLCKFDENGELYYIERADNQVKIRGLRIELGEVENKILEFPFINKAKVIKQKIGDREILSAYFIASKRIRITDLRKYLHDTLPNYMIPSYFTPLDDFPYTPNGKIDKNALPIPNGILKNNHKYIAPKTDLEVKLVAIWEQILNTKPIGITDNFFELGGDSILAMNLTIQLLKFTDQIKYADIFTYPTIADLENKINSNTNHIDNEKLYNLENKYNKILDNNIIVPQSLNYNCPKNILLTGVTGFLGIHFLDSFLKNESGKIYVIIRKEPGLTVYNKLLYKLHYYFDTKYDALINDRIIIIEGDTTSIDFGLNQTALFNLMNSVDVIVNSAAKVSHYGSYQDFYNINVKSVENLINLSNTFNKKLFHISTLSVSGNSFVDQYYNEQTFSEKVNFDESSFYIGQSLDNVYIKSKFEAENLILNAIINGSNAFILRVGNLMPRYSDGKFQENYMDNAYINRLQTFLNIGYIPDYLLDGYLEFTPIDYTSDAILKIIQHSNNTNRIFHIFNNNHLSIKDLLKILNNFGITLNILDANKFKNIIKNILNSKNSDILNNLINDFDKNMNLAYDNKITIKSDFTIKYLELCNFKWPNIDKNYIEKIIQLLKGA